MIYNSPMLRLLDEHGAVAVYGLPYLEPDAVRAVLPADPGGSPQEPRGHAGVLGRAMACVRADLATRHARSVVLAHAWVSGGQVSDSERDITVGGVGAVGASLFDGIDYTALGHLHGAQVLRPGLRYSGSPLAYSFSEAGHTKGSWLVELDAGGLGAVVQVPSPPTRRLSALCGTLEALLLSPTFAEEQDDWLSVVLTELLQNAVDHGFPEGSGGGEVQVGLSHRDQHLTIRVVDNGRGVDPAFDIDQATGLGLSIVRTLVTTELNGTIDIRPATSDDLRGAGLGDGAGHQHGTVIELLVPTDD